MGSLSPSTTHPEEYVDPTLVGEAVRHATEDKRIPGAEKERCSAESTIVMDLSLSLRIPHVAGRDGIELPGCQSGRARRLGHLPLQVNLDHLGTCGHTFVDATLGKW